MKILSNIFNKELPIGSFVMRVLSFILFSFFALSALISLFFSQVFFDTIVFIYNKTIELSNLFLSTLYLVFTLVVDFLIDTLVYLNVFYIYQNKLLLSLTLISTISVLMSYRFITCYKNGYKPYYKKYYVISSILEMVLATALLNIMLIAFIDTFYNSISPLYDSLIRAIFIIYTLCFPAIFFINQTIKSSLLLSKYKYINIYIKDGLRKSQSEGVFMIPFVIILFLSVILIFIGSSENENKIILSKVFSSIVLYLALLYLFTLISISIDLLKEDISFEKTMVKISNFDFLLNFYENDLNFIKDTFNISNEKDFYIMYLNIETFITDIPHDSLPLLKFRSHNLTTKARIEEYMKYFSKLRRKPSPIRAGI
jgi:hypothetical protein